MARAFTIASESKSDEAATSGVYARLAAVFVESKSLDDALKAARLVTDYPIQAEALVDVAIALRSAGRRAEALTAAAEAIEAAKRVDHHPEELDPGRTLLEVAERFVQAGFVREALTAAGEIAIPSHPDRGAYAANAQQAAFASAARGAADSGMFVEALEAARLLKSESDAGDALARVVELMAGAGNVDGASAIARSTASEYHQQDAFGYIANAHAKRGDAAGMLQAAKRIASAPASALLTRLASEANEAGNRGLAEVARKNALAFARQADDLARLDLLPSIARLNLAVKQSSQAEAIANELVTVAARYLGSKGADKNRVEQAARALAETGFITQAKAIVDAIPAGRIRNIGLRNIADVLKGLGRVGEADALRARIKDDPSDPTDAPTVPRAVPPSPTPDTKPVGTPQEVLAQLQKLPKSENRDKAASDLAVTFAAERNADGVLASIRLIDDRPFHDDKLDDAIELLLEKGGDANAAARLANDMRDQTAKAAARVLILDARPQFVDRGFLEHALSDTERLTHIGNRSTSLAKIAIGFARVGDLRRARLIADSCLATDRLTAYAVIMDGYTMKATKKSPQVGKVASSTTSTALKSSR